MSLVSSLASICIDKPLREKILVVPSLAIGHQIGDAVAEGGTPWINLRPETIRTIADAIAGFQLAHEGLTVLSRAQALAIVERACDEVLDSSSYFGALKDRPGLHRAVQKSIDDLRHAGLTPSEVPASAFEDPRKASDLGKILAAYERELTNGRFVDRFGVLSRAITMLENGAARPWSPDAVWIVLDELELSTAEQRLLALASGGAVQTLAVDDTAPAVTEFRRAVGEENELRSAFRAIVDERVPFDRAEIVYTTREPYLPLAFELAAEYDIPCTFAEGIAAHYTRPGQAVLGFLRWIAGGWDAAHLSRIARSGAVAFGSESAIKPWTFARVLRKAGIGWGRDRHLARIDVLIAGYRRKLEDEEADESKRASIERWLAEAEGAREVVARLLDITANVAVDGDADPADAARAARQFVAAFGAIRNEIDGMASAGLCRMLEELAALPGRKTSRANAVARLSDAVVQLHVAASNPRPGNLHVAPVRAGGWSSRRRMFIVGADDTRHPGRGLQDPIVLDSERDAINLTLDPGQLLLLGDAPRRATEQFNRLVARSGGRSITLSYSELDLVERRRSYPAPVFLQLYRTRSGNANASYEDVERAVAREGFVDPTPLSGSEWWLARRFAEGDRNLRPAAVDSYANLTSGVEAEAARSTDELTRWDGRIDATVEEVDPRRNGRVYSASQIETMAACPYRFFLSRTLGIKPLEDLAFDPDTWLGPRDYGTMFHTVLQKTMVELAAAGTKPAPAFLPQMRELADAELLEWRSRVPLPNEAAFQRQRRDMLRSCEIFLRNEEEWCRNSTPKFFEVSFGMGEESSGIAMPEPLTIDLGRGASIRLRGRIDRIDHDEAKNEWHVWDYKSGGTYKFDDNTRLQSGKKVQHAIYSRALEAMLARRGMSGHVAQSGYFFPTPKGRAARIVPVMQKGELEQVLNTLFDIIGSGVFPHAGADACKWCDFNGVCGGSDPELKAADPALAAWFLLKDM